MVGGGRRAGGGGRRARVLQSHERVPAPLADIRAARNAFGRQVHSFEADLDVGEAEPLRAVFIRAPWIEDAGPDVEILAEVDGHPVLARDGRTLVAAFHPELTDDTRIHELFLDLVREASSVGA